jgi:putative membrane protein
MIDVSQLPTLNATLNALAGVLLAAGFLAIRHGRVRVHRALMVTAFATSMLFLASYLTYHVQVPSTPFRGEGLARGVYFAILVPHIVLAALVVPLALLVLYRALRSDFPRHRHLARWTLPIWLYVSVTGVLVYLMLYVWFPGP